MYMEVATETFSPVMPMGMTFWKCFIAMIEDISEPAITVSAADDTGSVLTTHHHIRWHKRTGTQQRLQLEEETVELAKLVTWRK